MWHARRRANTCPKGQMCSAGNQLLDIEAHSCGPANVHFSAQVRSTRLVSIRRRRYCVPVTFNAVRRFVAKLRVYSLLKFGREPHLEVHRKKTAVLPLPDTQRSVA